MRRMLSACTLCSVLMALSAVFLFAGCSKENAGKQNNKDIYLYQGADRDQKILAGAKKEGTVVIYTSLNLKDSQPLTEVFEKKYGIKVVLWRAGSEKVLQRAVTEANAKRYDVDVLETNGPEMEAFYREKLLEEFYSPAFKDLPPQAFPPHKQYVPDRFNFFVMGYNTKMVKPEEVPTSYEDLLKPKWVGRIGLESSDVDWFGAVVKAMGEEKGIAYFKKLATMKPALRTGHTLIAELVASGEIPLALDVYNHGIERLKVKGAPVDWKPLQPAFGRPNAVGVARNAPHPYAAMLFTDFILSKEGQEIIKERNRVPSSLAVDSPLNKFEYKVIDPVIVLDESEKWEKLWSQIFLKGEAVKREGD